MRYFPNQERATIEQLALTIAHSAESEHMDCRDYVDHHVTNGAGQLIDLGAEEILINGRMFPIETVVTSSHKIAYMLDRRGKVDYS